MIVYILKLFYTSNRLNKILHRIKCIVHAIKIAVNLPPGLFVNIYTIKDTYRDVSQ
jgi:hypothetical protein